MAHLAQSSYNETLHKHHKWYIRKAVTLAVYTLPSREHFLSCFDTDADVLKQNITDIVHAVNQVYAVIQTHYAEYDLLELP